MIKEPCKRRRGPRRGREGKEVRERIYWKKRKRRRDGYGGKGEM